MESMEANPTSPPPASAGGRTTARIARTSAGDAHTRELIARLVDVSQRGLPRMFDRDERIFVHCLRRDAAGTIAPEGQSLRYSAIVLLGARWLDDDQQRALFAGETAREFASRALAHARDTDDLGDASLCAWAAFELGHPDAARALERALALESKQASPFTVELAWLVSALAAAPGSSREGTARRIAHRLLEGFSAHARVFPHRVGEPRPGFRAHVACFADQVYPIQALSRLHRRYGADRGLDAASLCAAQICEVQGEGGQWWWHYDARTGAVVEGYPVYSVHQDAMAPMCLLDLEEAGGPSFGDAIRRGLQWMAEAPEIGRSLIDDAESVIWRKVARIGPNKSMRAVRAAASRVREDLRLRFLDPAFPPRAVDWESRPYHPGWVLHTWLNES
ncbi:MAG: hypothetical protein R3E88_19645 [Myxococcota bacterium]